MIESSLSSSSSPSFEAHWNLYPRQYVAPYTSNPPIVLDGNVYKKEWEHVPWSMDFDDIRGPTDAPYSSRPIANSCRTRMKMMWDEEYLYIAALIESKMEIRATFHQRNSPIFQQDSDFEVFVDPLSCCHSYKELEMNAFNTVWNLMLNKPYWDGGTEHSGRIAQPGEPNYYDVYHQKTAVQLLQGSLNTACPDKSCQKNVWAVEVALSHPETLQYQSSGKKPKVGDLWRINFSRVEEKGNINWTWQPQRVWDPKLRKHGGKVDMHLPDAWGYLQFGDSTKTDDAPSDERQEIVVDPHWPAKLVAMNIYYAQKQYHDLHSNYASSINQLSEFWDEALIEPFLPNSKGNDGYQIKLEIPSLENQYVIKAITPSAIVSVTNDRLMTVHERNSSTNDASSMK